MASSRASYSSLHARELFEKASATSLKLSSSSGMVMESQPPPSCSCIGGTDDCVPTAKSFVVKDTTLFAMERSPSALATAAAECARRVPNDREGATAAVDKMDGPTLALARLGVPVFALCTVNGLWDLLRGRASSDRLALSIDSSLLDLSTTSDSSITSS